MNKNKDLKPVPEGKIKVFPNYQKFVKRWVL